MAVTPVHLESEVRRIVIFRALFLGDMLITTPAWRALRRRFPKAELTLIGLPWARDLLAHLPGLFDRFMPFVGYPGLDEVPCAVERTLQFLEAQRARHYDLAIQMHGDGRVSNELVRELGAKTSLGLGRAGDRRLTTILPYGDDSQNEVLRWLNLVAKIGAPNLEPQLEFELLPRHIERVREILARPAGGAPLIGLHTGARDPGRRWPSRNFATLGHELHRRTGAALVLTGGADERMTNIVVRSMADAPVVDMTARTTLGEFAAVLAELDLLITNDTSASHLAAALGVPSVVLFGPTRPERYAPLDGALHCAVDAVAYAGPRVTPELALRTLPVEPVFAAALAQLEAHRAPARAALGERALGA